MQGKVLVVDLNNFAMYPSIAIGYLHALLEEHGYDVDVLTPLSVGLSGVPREPRPPWWGVLNQEFRYRTAVSQRSALRKVRAWYAKRQASELGRSREKIVREFKQHLEQGFDAVLVSTYLMYYEHCRDIAAICDEQGIPLIIGGPYFNTQSVASEWVTMPGVSALVGGEVEPDLGDIVRDVMKGNSLDGYRGVWRKNGSLSIDAPPLKDLDSLPFPDYSAFPWSKYPKVVVPIITGRGCGWGACTFCSDVTSTVGRTYRTRSPENVLREVEHHHSRYGAKLFVFTDLKLNSNVAVWHGLAKGVQDAAPGSKWIGAVHVGIHGEQGLDRESLAAARQAGMVRLTTGLESGSQRVLDSMAKGTHVESNSLFLRDAHGAGLSVRLTLIIGHPGEEAEDVRATADFLDAHRDYVERIALNRFQIISGTRAAARHSEEGVPNSGVVPLTVDRRTAMVQHHYKPTESRQYRREISRLIRVVHGVNRKPLNEAARDFEGVM